MDTKNFTIGVLSTTAAILFVGVLIVGSRPAVVHASGMTASGGAYSLTVGRLTSAEEMLYVIDAAGEKMLTFSFDSGRKSIKPIQAVSLAEVRKSAAGVQPAQPGRQQPRQRGSRSGGTRRTPTRPRP